jgi:hypothetical protein
MARSDRVEPDQHEADTPTDLATRLRVLDGLEKRDLSEHPEVYRALHEDLQSALAEIDGA